MDSKYIDLIKKSFDFPQEDFKVENNELYYNNLPLMDLVKKHQTPLKLSYLPKIGSQINNARNYFNNAFKKVDYKGSYTYCYCTKSSHFSFVLEEVLKNNAQIETSSAYDIDIIENLFEKGLLTKDIQIINNGFKREQYLKNISRLVNSGFKNTIPVLDNMEEFEYYEKNMNQPCNLGIRIATEEEPRFDFYTSRLGVRYKAVLDFYKTKIQPNKLFRFKMLHFFINTGMKDSAYYWNELNKVVKLYCDLKKICPDLDSLNIGGGFPIKTSLNFSYDYDYQYMVDEIIAKIKDVCEKEGVEEPNIYTEFGSYTVGESGASLFSIIGEKLQNDRELWYMIDSSFMVSLPDIWAINQKFILLPLNLWNNEYQRVNLGGLTCDSEDFYTTDSHENQVFLPIPNPGETLYIGLFNTGAYQESIGGYGGIQHCLVPYPKHLVIENQNKSFIFSEEQKPENVLKILGYK